jgi:hypothetical protein
VESILSPLGTSASIWPIVPVPGDYAYGEFDGMKIGRGNRTDRYYVFMSVNTFVLCSDENNLI